MAEITTFKSNVDWLLLFFTLLADVKNQIISTDTEQLLWLFAIIHKTRQRSSIYNRSAYITVRLDTVDRLRTQKTVQFKLRKTFWSTCIMCKIYSTSSNLKQQQTITIVKTGPFTVYTLLRNNSELLITIKTALLLYTGNKTNCCNTYAIQCM
jgi:hypothetical protein